MSTNDYYLKVANYIYLQVIKPATLVKLDKICQIYFFLCESIKSEKFSFELFLATLKIALAASTLWQNSCKTRFPQKNICDEVHSYYNSNFKMHIVKYINEN